jgi:glycosyltransferase involved in cell wall biosynthesis
MTPPRLSVLMTVYNAGAFLDPAIESVLAQDCRDFEFIIVDDGSTDSSVERVRRYGDPRIRLHVNARNLGQTPALNVGLDLCRGTYIVRMDADDVCLPGRFSRQAAFLDAYPEIGILGGAMYLIDAKGRRFGHAAQPCGDTALRWSSMTRNPFNHPTVMLRTELLRRTGQRFDEQYGANQDYDLWDRLIPHTRIANLRDPLLGYRIHGGNISIRRAEEQMRCGIAFSRRRTRHEAGLDVPASAMAGIYRSIYGSRPQPTIPETGADEALRAFLDLTEAFFARNGSADLGEARWAAAGTAMRCWLVKPVADRRFGLLQRIHRIHPLAAVAGLQVLVPQVAGVLKTKIGIGEAA